MTGSASNRPAAAACHPALARYVRAWEDRQFALDDVFTPDAVYVYRPPGLAPPLEGLEAIRQYWSERVLGEQKCAKVEILRTVEQGNEVWAEWHAQVVLHHRRISFPIWGTMILELASDGRIQRLTEYYFVDPRKYQRVLVRRGRKKQRVEGKSRENPRKA